MEALIKKLNYYADAVAPSGSAPHFHNGYELIYVASGSVKIEIDGVTHDAAAPSVILLNPFEWHRLISSAGDYKRYALVADSEQAERQINSRLVSMIKCRPEGFRHAIPLDENSAPIIDEIFKTISREYAEDKPYKNRLMSNEFYNLLIILYRLNPAGDSFFNENVMNIQQYINENYRTIESVNAVAKRFFISPEYLSRVFKKYSGYSPMEYLINTRLYRAQLLLAESAKSVAKICAEVGFRDINNFTRQFRLKYGMPPLAFRKRRNS